MPAACPGFPAATNDFDGHGALPVLRVRTARDDVEDMVLIVDEHNAEDF